MGSRCPPGRSCRKPVAAAGKSRPGGKFEGLFGSLAGFLRHHSEGQVRGSFPLDLRGHHGAQQAGGILKHLFESGDFQDIGNRRGHHHEQPGSAAVGWLDGKNRKILHPVIAAEAGQPGLQRTLRGFAILPLPGLDATQRLASALLPAMLFPEYMRWNTVLRTWFRAKRF